MATWSKTFTNIDNVNNGQEFENSDYPTKEAFNVALNNTQALKQVTDNQATTISNQATSISNIEQRLNQLGFKRGYFDAFITYEDDDPDTGVTYEVTEQISSSDISRNILTREGNRFMFKFEINRPYLYNYAGTRFKKLKLVAHGTDGATDDDFKFYYGFSGQYFYANVKATMTYNFSDSAQVDLAVQMRSGSSERNTLSFGISNVTNAFNGPSNYRIYSVDGVWISNGMSATQDII